ncbi:MAG: site-specific DNA-methyltransferase, partial [Anaerolineales bacterium]|jgi:DNA modification methylase
MAHLSWKTKTPPTPLDNKLELESIIYPGGVGYPDVYPTDYVIMGDNLAVMWALLPEFEGLIDLIYVDPPFYTNRRYPSRVGRGEDSRRPQDWQLADGYEDHWPNLEAYLDMLYPRLLLMHRLLAPTGTLYLHLDWHANSYARILLDEIFGQENLLNEIVWVYHGPSPIRSAFNRKHDTILAYTKSSSYTFNVDEVRQPYDPNTVKTFASSPKAGFGKVPNLERGKVPEDWWYFPVVARLHSERTGYPTQKPEALLERIILASSNPGDLVADFFCGSGTTAAVAAQHGRRFIVGDATWRAMHTTRSRLVERSAGPFSLQFDDPKVINTSESKVNRGKLGDESSVKICESESGIKVMLDEDTLADLDYWEADPQWDGNVFKSASQAIRPRRKGIIRQTLQIPKVGDTQQIAIRMVNLKGDQFQINFG